VLIKACIIQGVGTGSHIIGVARALGFNSRHIGAALTKGAGNKDRYDWFKGADGKYHCHD